MQVQKNFNGAYSSKGQKNFKRAYATCCMTASRDLKTDAAFYEKFIKTTHQCSTKKSVKWLYSEHW